MKRIFFAEFLRNTQMTTNDFIIPLLMNSTSYGMTGETPRNSQNLSNIGTETEMDETRQTRTYKIWR